VDLVTNGFKIGNEKCLMKDSEIYAPSAIFLHSDKNLILKAERQDETVLKYQPFFTFITFQV
jgi:hypothetical protein